MPIFENKGVKYDVSPEYIPDFASEYPDAVTVIERPDKPYRVKASQYDIFMQQHPEPDISVDEMRAVKALKNWFSRRGALPLTAYLLALAVW